MTLTTLSIKHRPNVGVLDGYTFSLLCVLKLLYVDDRV